jgi:4,5-dihydroxyphthalate decarboxylase
MGDLFARVLQRQPFDVCEFSLANYIKMRDSGADWLLAIPVFPNRAFRHGTLMVRRDSKTQGFSDLRGRRVGIADYSMTGGVWVRGLLDEVYGVHWSEIDWVSTSQPRFAPPAGVRISLVSENLEDMLADGHIDALLDPANRDAMLPLAKRRFRPLLRNHEAEELLYYRKTGIFPIHHTLVINREALGGDPALPGAVFGAYSESMASAKRRRLGASFVPWSNSAWATVMDIFGEDPLQYGLGAANRKVINKLQYYLLEQKLIGRRHALSELFAVIGDHEMSEDYGDA